MGNLTVWDALKDVPKSALKEIKFGYLKGKSDISPQWRYKAMTEQFGPCGVGWRFEIVKLWNEPSNDGQIFAFATVHLFIKHDGEWSEAIPGNGGNMLIQFANSKLKGSDEGYKMAITDALGTAMKMIGVAATVYSGGAEETKYDQYQKDTSREAPPPTQQQDKNEPQGGKLNTGWYVFLQTMNGHKKALGDEEYYRILGHHGFTKSNEVGQSDAKTQKTIHVDMLQAVKLKDK